MTERIASVIRGVGSVLDLIPSDREPNILEKYTPLVDAECAMRSAWQKTGDAIRSAIDEEVVDR